MKNITSLYLFQFYVSIFFNVDIINLNINTRNVLNIIHDINIKSFKDFVLTVAII